MGVVGSLPSPPPPPPAITSDDTLKIACEESMPSSDDCDYSIIMKDEIDSNTDSSLNSNIDNQDAYNSYEHSRQQMPVTVVYSPMDVKVRRAVAPTLATGRRSKFMQLEGVAALRRELRRKRNRDAAKKLKERRINLEQQLENDIRELESKEEDLLSRIRNLEAYKEQLEFQHNHIIAIQERIARSASSTLRHVECHRREYHQNVSVHRNNTYIKEEPEPPSPQWQLLFSI